jgi:hypothetical protein
MNIALPMGERPVHQSAIMENALAVQTFMALANSVNPHDSQSFTRHAGHAALIRLQNAAAQFERAHLQQG